MSILFDEAAALLRRVVERTLERGLELCGWIVDGGNRLYWAYLLASVAIAWLAYRLNYRDALGHGRKGWRFLFSPAIYTHPSAILDYKLTVANQLLGPVSILSGLLLRGVTTTTVALLVADFLGGLGRPEAPLPPMGVLSGFALFVVLTLAYDFSTYVTHRLHHTIPLLWEFHKVHHSAEVLTPLTLYRKHPVYDFLGVVSDLLLVGPIQGVVLFLFGVEPPVVLLLGGNILYSLFHLAGSNLRHSHIWLSFGPVLGRLVISPAQHQVHHSKAQRHWNRNYGEMFALWDWLFGTLYLTGRQPEPMEFGVAGAAGQEHPTLWAAYTVPFTNGARLLRHRLRRLRGSGSSAESP